MSIPIGTVPVPDVVSRIAVGRPVHPRWANEIGGLTFQIGDGTGREFVKVAPPHPEIDAVPLENVKGHERHRYIASDLGDAALTADAALQARKWLRMIAGKGHDLAVEHGPGRQTLCRGHDLGKARGQQLLAP